MGKFNGHTKGPWRWQGDTAVHRFDLSTTYGGRIFVMDFVRFGMQRAQPRFQVPPSKGHMVPAKDLVRYEVTYRKDITGIDHPDARLIEAAPQLLELCRKQHEVLMSIRHAELDRDGMAWGADYDAAIKEYEKLVEGE